MTCKLTTTLSPSLMPFQQNIDTTGVFESTSFLISITSKQIGCFKTLVEPKQTFVCKRYPEDVFKKFVQGYKGN